MRLLLAPAEVPISYPLYWTKLEYPLFGSPKLDGIRACTDHSFQLKSRTWKPIPSVQAQEDFGKIAWVDGELIEGNWTDFDVYNRTQSHVMSVDKPGNLSYHLFDYANPDWHHRPYFERLEFLQKLNLPENFHIVEQKLLENRAEVEEYEETQLALGFEGIMLRGAVAPYKTGRATINQGIIYKLKRFQDAEGIVVGFVERMLNNNELTKDERGYAKRSSAKEGLVPAGTLGKFLVDFEGLEISVAPGHFSHDELQHIWDNRDFYKGHSLKFRFFAHGIKDQPRHARALGWRSDL